VASRVVETCTIIMRCLVSMLLYCGWERSTSAVRRPFGGWGGFGWGGGKGIEGEEEGLKGGGRGWGFGGGWREEIRG